MVNRNIYHLSKKDNIILKADERSLNDSLFET